MLHVNVDLLPGGHAARRRTVGGLVVGQISRSEDGYSYGAALWHDRRPEVVDVVEITAFRRRDAGLWDLLRAVLLTSPGEHGLAPAVEVALRRHLAALVPASAATALGDGRHV